VATATLNELEVSEYCRRQGVFPEQVAAWRLRGCEKTPRLADSVGPSG